MEIITPSWEILDAPPEVISILETLYIKKKWHPIRWKFKTRYEEYILRYKLGEYSRCSSAIFKISDFSPFLESH